MVINCQVSSLIFIRLLDQLLSQDVKELFIVERDVVFSAHASCANLTAKCVKRLSRMRGPGGSQCNMFVEAHPEPAPWRMSRGPGRFKELGEGPLLERLRNQSP